MIPAAWAPAVLRVARFLTSTSPPLPFAEVWPPTKKGDAAARLLATVPSVPPPPPTDCAKMASAWTPRVAMAALRRLSTVTLPPLPSADVAPPISRYIIALALATRGPATCPPPPPMLIAFRPMEPAPAVVMELALLTLTAPPAPATLRVPPMVTPPAAIATSPPPPPIELARIPTAFMPSVEIDGPLLTTETVPPAALAGSPRIWAPRPPRPTPPPVPPPAEPPLSDPPPPPTELA